MDHQWKPGSSTSTANAHGTLGAVAPGKRTLVEHALVAPRVAERERLNAVLKVVAYDAQGGVIGAWGAKARWDGPLPKHFHGDHSSGRWIWDDAASVHTVRIHARVDGSGGEATALIRQQRMPPRSSNVRRAATGGTTTKTWRP